MAVEDPIAYRYVADKNPDQGSFPGIPLRDLTKSDLEGQPEWLIRSVDASPFYRATNKAKDLALEPVKTEEKPTS